MRGTTGRGSHSCVISTHVGYLVQPRHILQTSHFLFQFFYASPQMHACVHESAAPGFECVDDLEPHGNCDPECCSPLHSHKGAAHPGGTQQAMSIWPRLYGHAYDDRPKPRT